MEKIAKLSAVVAVAAVFAFSGALAAPQRPARHIDQSMLIDQAERTVDHMRNDPAFGPARDTLRRARAVLIVPALVKGGFIFGAEGGNGVLLSRTRDRWSEPAFFTMGSASFGFQAGLEQAEIVMLVMSDRALKAIEDGNVKIGAGGGLTVATLSGGAEAATAANLTGDLILWTSASGLYGGLTLNGSVIKPRDEWNEQFYGRPVSVQAILTGKVGSPEANPLRAKLASVQRVRAEGR